MLKRKLVVLRAPADANTGTSSSTAPDDNGQESSPEQQAEEEATEEGEQSSDDAAADPATEATGEEQPEEVAPEDGEEKEESKTPEVAEPVLDKPEDDKLPFHKHPRFQEVISEKNQLRQEIEASKPLVEQAKAMSGFITQNGIDPKELTNALEYLRLRRQDPAKAFELLKADYQALAGYVGEVIPDDLSAEVAAGTLSTERAKEIAQARARQAHMQWQGQSHQQVQQQMHEQMIQGAINTWASTKMQQDTAFRPKQDATKPDGKWEIVDAKLRSARQMNPPRSAEEAIAQVEQAYKDADALFKQFRQPAKPVKPALRSGASQQNASAVVKTPEDVVRAILAGKKPQQMKYQ